MNRDELAALLQHLGHWPAAVVTKTPTRKWPNGAYVGMCECGYTSTHRQTLRLAIEAVEHHRRLVIRAARASGVSLPAVRASA